MAWAARFQKVTFPWGLIITMPSWALWLMPRNFSSLWPKASSMASFSRSLLMAVQVRYAAVKATSRSTARPARVMSRVIRAMSL